MLIRNWIVLCGVASMTLLLEAQIPAPSAPPPQPAPAPGSSVPVFRSAIEASHVDVTVLDRDNRPVIGLTADDFQLLVGGTPREIIAFAHVETPATPATSLVGLVESDIASNVGAEGRLYVFALDDVEPSRALRTRHLLRQFIENDFGAHDVAAVVHLGRTSKSSGQDFTSSRQRLLAAIDKFSGGFPAEDNSTQDPDAVAAEEAALAINQLESLAAVVELMAKLPAGRKALLLVTEGLRQVDVGRTLNSRARARYLKDVCVLVDTTQKSCTPSQLLHRTLAAAAEGNIVIYPIDPTGLTGTTRDFNLSELAEATGGFSVANTNAFAEGFARIARDHSNYYLLGFEANRAATGGRSMALQVRVDRPNVTVQTRTNYVTPFAEERRRFSPPHGSPVAIAMANPVATRGVPMRVAAAPFKGTGDQASIMLLVDLDAAALRLVESNGLFEGRLHVWHVATGDGGKKYPVAKQTVQLSLQPATRARMISSGLRLLTPLSLPAGRYQVRVAAGDDMQAGSVIYDLDVPDFRQRLSLSGLLLYSRLEDVVTVRSASAASYPGSSGRNPTNSRDFARSDTVTVYAELYGSDAIDRDVRVTAELHEPSGGLALTRITQLTTALPSGGRGVAIELPLSEVQAGAYTLRVYVTSGRNERPSLSRSLAIHVR